MKGACVKRETRLEAARGGRIRYLYNPCKRCGDPERYTSSGKCVTCTLVRSTEDQRRLRDTLREAKKGGSD